MQTLDEQIAEWRSHLSAGTTESDLEELESHLRDQVDDLAAVGLSDDEAFLIAVKRIGGADELSREYAREHSGRLWKQLLPPASRPDPGLGSALAIAAAAAVAVHLPRFAVDPAGDPLPMLRNVPVIVLAFLGLYFLVRRGPTVRTAIWTGIPFLIATLVLNLYPWDPDGQMVVISIPATTTVLWFTIGLPYMGGTWRDHERRMDFIRFTGEWFIYMVLIALGGGVLTGLTAVLLGEGLVEWLVISGAAGAVVVAAWLVESKQSVVENMAPVLTSVFTPLFAVLLVAASVDHLAGGFEFDRETLGIYDGLLVVVFGLVLYATSARDPERPPGWMDRIQLVAVGSALLLDGLVLGSMIARVGEFGLTPNRVTALTLNLVLLVNLVWAGWLGLRFVTGRTVFHRMERWQTTYLPVFGLWAATIAAVLPLLFDFA